MKNKMDALIDAFAEVLSESEVTTAIQLGKISAILETSRIQRGMTQKDFAEYMGVSQGMVSKWESEEYNFTVATLAKICEKLNLTLEISMKPQWTSFNDAGISGQRNAWKGVITSCGSEKAMTSGVA